MANKITSFLSGETGKKVTKMFFSEIGTKVLKTIYINLKYAIIF
mgnify:CR=1 FL=1